MNESTLRRILDDLSAAFEQRDVHALLAQFSAAPTATYAGSEAGESATGPPALRALFTALFDRDAVYAFRFPRVVHSQVSDCVWVLGEGEGVEMRPRVHPAVFAYRITGVLVPEEGTWRWAVLCGTEPGPPASLSA